MPDSVRHPDPRIYGWIPAFAGMTFPICKYVTELANKTTKLLSYNRPFLVVVVHVREEAKMSTGLSRRRFC